MGGATAYCGFGAVGIVSTIGQRVEEALKSRATGEEIPSQIRALRHLRALNTKRHLTPSLRVRFRSGRRGASEAGRDPARVGATMEHGALSAVKGRPMDLRYRNIAIVISVAVIGLSIPSKAQSLAYKTMETSDLVKRMAEGDNRGTPY